MTYNGIQNLSLFHTGHWLTITDDQIRISQRSCNVQFIRQLSIKYANLTLHLK